MSFFEKCPLIIALAISSVVGAVIAVVCEVSNLKDDNERMKTQLNMTSEQFESRLKNMESSFSEISRELTNLKTQINQGLVPPPPPPPPAPLTSGWGKPVNKSAKLSENTDEPEKKTVVEKQLEFNKKYGLTGSQAVELPIEELVRIAQKFSAKEKCPSIKNPVPMGETGRRRSSTVYKEPLNSTPCPTPPSTPDNRLKKQVS